MNYNDNQLDEIFASLPEELQDYIMSPEVSEALEDIVSKEKSLKKTSFDKRSILRFLDFSRRKTLQITWPVR